MDLKDKRCVPCKGPVPTLDQEQKLKLLNELGANWKLSPNSDRLFRDFSFKNFVKALEFTNLIGQIAEAEKHHPEINLSWGHVKVIIWTHTNNNLHENDFILAAKIEEAFIHLS